MNHSTSNRATTPLITTFLVGVALATLTSCSTPTPGAPDGAPAESPTTAETSAPSTSGATDLCAEYAAAVSHPGMTYEVWDQWAFDDAVGFTFIGPADCYVGFTVSADDTSVSAFALFIDNDPAIADFMNSELPFHGYEGSADANGNGHFANPQRGGIDYTLNLDPAASGLPIDEPIMQVTFIGMD